MKDVELVSSSDGRHVSDDTRRETRCEQPGSTGFEGLRRALRGHPSRRPVSDVLSTTSNVDWYRVTPSFGNTTVN